MRSKPRPPYVDHDRITALERWAARHPVAHVASELGLIGACLTTGLAELRAAVTCHDARQAAWALHRLRGGLGAVGLSSLAAACDDNHESHASMLTAAQDAVATVEPSLASALDELSSLLLDAADHELSAWSPRPGHGRGSHIPADTLAI